MLDPDQQITGDFLRESCELIVVNLEKVCEAGKFWGESCDPEASLEPRMLTENFDE